MTWVIWIFVALVGAFVFWQAEQVDCSTSPGGTDACPARRVVVSTPVLVQNESREWEEIAVGEISGVIVPERAAGSLLSSRFPELESGDFWTPTLMDVKAVESVIAAEQGQLDHMRQYAGFIENGERKVLVNGFCDALGIDWRSAPVLVDDGGECFFTAIYNVDQVTLETFRFNGEG